MKLLLFSRKNRRWANHDYFFWNEIFSCCLFLYRRDDVAPRGSSFFFFIRPCSFAHTAHSETTPEANFQVSLYYIFAQKTLISSSIRWQLFPHTHTSMVVTKKRKLMMTSNPLKYGWRNKEHRVSYQRCQPKRSITIQMQIANRSLSRSTCAW